jgi:hypothetical protein
VSLAPLVLVCSAGSGSRHPQPASLNLRREPAPAGNSHHPVVTTLTCRLRPLRPPHPSTLNSWTVTIKRANEFGTKLTCESRCAHTLPPSNHSDSFPCGRTRLGALLPSAPPAPQKSGPHNGSAGSRSKRTPLILSPHRHPPHPPPPRSMASDAIQKAFIAAQKAVRDGNAAEVEKARNQVLKQLTVAYMQVRQTLVTDGYGVMGGAPTKRGNPADCCSHLRRGW